MYCSNCGSKIEIGDRFCTYCGAAIIPRPGYTEPASSQPAPSQPAQSQPIQPQPTASLPDGIIIDEDGIIRWEWEEKGKKLYFWLDENQIGYQIGDRPGEEKEPTVGSLIKAGFAIIFDFATQSEGRLINMIPDYTEKHGLHFMQIMRITPEKNKIKIEGKDINMDIFVADHQYSFILDYIIRHSPEAEVK